VNTIAKSFEKKASRAHQENGVDPFLPDELKRKIVDCIGDGRPELLDASALKRVRAERRAAVDMKVAKKKLDVGTPPW
jgi:hypothetical protein